MPLTCRSACLVALLSVLAGCASAPERSSDHDPGTDLAAYRSFAWRLSPAQAAGDTPQSLVDARVRGAVREELTRRGYVEDEAQPGFLIAWEVIRKEKVKSNPFRIGIGMGGSGGNVGGSVNVGTPAVKNVVEAEIVIHAIDAAGNREVWYGTATDDLGADGLDTAAVTRAVGLAMQDFPARTAAAAPPPD